MPPNKASVRPSVHSSHDPVVRTTPSSLADPVFAASSNRTIKHMRCCSVGRTWELPSCSCSCSSSCFCALPMSGLLLVVESADEENGRPAASEGSRGASLAVFFFVVVTKVVVLVPINE